MDQTALHELPQEIDFSNAPLSSRREASLLESIRLENVLKRLPTIFFTEKYNSTFPQ